jgi:hypothetical protein
MAIGAGTPHHIPVIITAAQVGFRPGKDYIEPAFLQEAVMRFGVLVLITALGASAGNAAAYGGTFSGGPGTGGYAAMTTASPEPGFYYGARPDARTSAKLSFVSQMMDLQHKGLKLQAKDGGSLSPEHRALLQSQLDKLRGRYASSTR